MDGIIYMLNQAGIALADCQRQIDELTAEVMALRKQLKDRESCGS